MHAVRRTGGHDHADPVVANEAFQKPGRRAHPEAAGIRQEDVAPDPGGDSLKKRRSPSDEVGRLRRAFTPAGDG